MKTEFCLEDWTVRPQRNSIRRGDEVVHLAPKAMAVLQCLADARGEVVSREELFDTVWPGAVISDDALTQRIVELRKAFGDTAQKSRFIKTIPKVGFRLVPLAEPLPERTTRLWVRIPAILVLLILALTVADRFWLNLVFEQRPDAATEPKSIAVLPFVNMSEDSKNEYFADGVSEELINLLTKVSELRVIGRTSSFYYKGKDIRLSHIAEELDVNHILEGSVRKDGDRVRITAQLIDANTEAHIWSDTYDRTLDDVFTIQSDIANTVVSKLRISLLGAPLAADEVDPRAYALWMQADHLLAYRFAEDTWQLAYELLDQAIAIEPDFKDALWLKTFRAGTEGHFGLIPQRQANEEQTKALKALIEKHPDYAPGHALLSALLAYEFDWAGAVEHMEKALALEPNNLFILRLASGGLFVLGRLEDSLKVREYAINRDPLDLFGYRGLARMYYLTGQKDKAIETLRYMQHLFPDHQLTTGANLDIGDIYLYQGEAQVALDIATQAEVDDFHQPGHKTALTAMAYYSLGEEESYQTALTELIQLNETQDPMSIAAVYAWAGNANECFAWLEQAIEKHQRNIAGHLSDPAYAPVRADPRWAAFKERIGLSPEQLSTIDFKVILPE